MRQKWVGLGIAVMCWPWCLIAQTPSVQAAGSVTDLSVGIPTTDSITLPGTLTLPAPLPVATLLQGPMSKPAPRPPIAVLVQGSGMQDRDATLGPNKFFEQLASGLATRGVAVLRYEPRATVAPGKFLEHADLDHDIVIDAASALQFAGTLPAIDERRVFLVGHSLGAQLAPDAVALRLVQLPGSVRGIVLLSGIARPIDKVIEEEVHALGLVEGATPAQISSKAAMWAEVFAQARDPGTPPGEMLGVGTQLPATYWRDWLRRDPVAALHTLNVPVLVLRGANDLTATHADFELLRHASTASDSGAHEFPALNKLFMAQPGGAGPSGQVSAEFLNDLAAWLSRTGAPLSAQPAAVPPPAP